MVRFAPLSWITACRQFLKLKLLTSMSARTLFSGVNCVHSGPVERRMRYHNGTEGSVMNNITWGTQAIVGSEARRKGHPIIDHGKTQKSGRSGRIARRSIHEGTLRAVEHCEYK